MLNLYYLGLFNTIYLISSLFRNQKIFKLSFFINILSKWFENQNKIFKQSKVILVNLLK